MADMQSDPNKDAQTDPTPTTPSASSVVVPAVQSVKSSRPITPSGTRSLAAFEASLIGVTTPDIAKELSNTMRAVAQLGGSNRKYLEPRQQKIRDIVMRSGSKEVENAYNEYAKLQVAAEKRLTYKLPLVGDVLVDENLGGQNDEDLGDAPRSSDVEAARRGKEPLSEEVSLEEARRGDSAEQDITMEDVAKAVSVQPSAPQHGHVSETAPRPLAPIPITTAPILEDVPLRPTKTPLRQTGITCDKHSGSECTLVPITNPDAFPVGRIQEVQAQYYPSTKVVAMWIHRDTDDSVTQVTADIDSGSINHLIINDARIITTLGVRGPPYETILLNQHESRIDETYKIRILPNQKPKNMKAWIAGELVAARHPYLHWLEKRQDADPKFPPTMAEARTLAGQLKRRLPHVMGELKAYWDLEHGSDGNMYRENRPRYLGEDPNYPGGHSAWPERSEWA